MLSSVFAFAVMSVGCQASGAETSASDLSNSTVREYVSQFARDREMSGVVLVMADDETVFRKAFNVEALSSEQEITPDTPFMVASLTKSFTAVLVLDQVRAGEIELDRSVRSYLPEFDAAYADVVTVRQLLENRSGIPHYTDIPGWFDPETKDSFTAESFLNEIASFELKFEPGEDYYYSNANYYLLGLILEAATGVSYESLLTELVLKPLALTSTGQIYAAKDGEVAPTYLRLGGRYERIDISNQRLFRATASLFSTVDDLASFGRAVVLGDLLDAATRSTLLDPDRSMGFTVASVPLGDGSADVVTYNGELAGTTSMLSVFPDQAGVVVVLSNNHVPYSALVELTLGIAPLALADR